VSQLLLHLELRVNDVLLALAVIRRWLRATGRTHWVLRTAHALPAGAYVAHVIAVDRAGNIELYTHRTGPHRNYIGFRVP